MALSRNDAGFRIRPPAAGQEELCRGLGRYAGVDDRARQLAKNEALFREINEHIDKAAETFAPRDEHVYEFLCECANRDCTKPIALTREQYEGIRADPRRFAVAAGHYLADIETVVGQHGDVLVVEKRGEAGELVEHFDPRERIRSSRTED